MEKIAIIGYSCLFPDAKNPDEFWHNLIEQKDSTSTITAEEIGVEPSIFYNPVKGKPDQFYSLKGAFIRDFKFDSKGYKLPPDFLDSLDNTFKWSLYVAQQALRDSGYLNKSEILAKCGVILGTLSLPTKYSNRVFAPIYQQILAPAIRELLQTENFDLPLPGNDGISASTHNAMISGLPAAVIAQALSLSNIHLCIDAACSSPQYSIRLASHYLWTHKADMMLAGGISAADPLFIRMLFSGIQGYPENNDISRPLDKSSRGLMTAEGSGLFVLKRYSDAVRDGDRIYAVIAGNGLSNDGRGKHLLSPNSKGQVLAFERAYCEANVNPRDIDYMECHATGTLLGDTTEFNSVETFFGKHQASPLVGSVKANVGHLLTAAGAVGLAKVLLSMSKGVIPATINVKEAIGNGNSVISPKNVVKSATNWSNKAPIKRAAISAFGFGGTNAHMILEQGMTTHPAHSEQPLALAKMAIVGMDAMFGNCNGLDAFDRSIYDCTQQFTSLPEERWHGIETQHDLLKQYGLTDGKAPQGAYVNNFDVDTLAYKIQPNELAKLNPQQLLLLKVADRALVDAGMKEGGNVAVLIATETEFSVHQLQQRWNLDWQVKEGLAASQSSLPTDTVNQLETVLKDAVHHPVEISEHVSYISNIMASRISALWDFTGPTFTITAGENSTFKVLEIAQHLLTTGEVDAVLVGAVDLAGGLEHVLLRNKLAPINTGINTLSYDQKANGWNLGEGAGAVVLKRHDSKAQDRVYAVIDAVSLCQQNSTPTQDLDKRLTTPDAAYVKTVSQQALQIANVQPSEVEYVEVYGSGIAEEDEAEIAGLLQAYPGAKQELNCALGSVKSNIGHTFVASGIASLIKTALCLYHRYIPGTPKWTGVKNQALWQGSPFYVAPESRPWFLNKDIKKRVAAINSIGIDGTYAHVILSEEPEQVERPSKYLEQTPFYLFPIAGSDKDLLAKLDNLQNQIASNSSNLAAIASQTFKAFQSCNNSDYALAIVGKNQTEISKEIDNAIKAVPKALETGEDWQTPLGSYFTAKPLGKHGEVAFIYPAAINSYIGISRNLFRLFPHVHEDKVIKSLYSLVADIAQLVFPRSLNKLTTRQLETLEKQLLEDSLAIFETDMGFARLITTIISDDFQVKPKHVFGYSLGETSMMSSTGVWSDFSRGINAFHISPLFGDRVSGAKNAVREYWGMPTVNQTNDDSFWSTYLLMADPDKVREHLKQEPRVYLTQINTPEEVVIAGDSQACQRAIKAIGCNAFRAPFNHAIHNEAMRSEYSEIVKLNTLPAQELPSVKFYSSAEYQPIALNSDTIAQSIGKCLCEPLDFPRLVNQVYSNGAKIFLETGSGNVCSRWIDKILENKPHTTISINRRGVDDHTSIVRALAKLLSHQVPLDLTPLYTQIETTTKTHKPTMKTVTVGGANIIEKILNPENRQTLQKIFQQTFQKLPNTNTRNSNLVSEHQREQKNLPKQLITTPKEFPMEKVTNNSLTSAPPIKFEKLPGTTIQTPETFSNQTNQTIPIQKLEPLTYRSNIAKQHLSQHLSKLNTNNSNINKNHAAFLEARQQFSKQMSEIIQLQIACAENLLK